MHTKKTNESATKKNCILSKSPNIIANDKTGPPFKQNFFKQAPAQLLSATRSPFLGGFYQKQLTNVLLRVKSALC